MRKNVLFCILLTIVLLLSSCSESKNSKSFLQELYEDNDFFVNVWGKWYGIDNTFFPGGVQISSNSELTEDNLSLLIDNQPITLYFSDNGFEASVGYHFETGLNYKIEVTINNRTIVSEVIIIDSWFTNGIPEIFDPTETYELSWKVSKVNQYQIYSEWFRFIENGMETISDNPIYLSETLNSYTILPNPFYTELFEKDNNTLEFYIWNVDYYSSGRIAILNQTVCSFHYHDGVLCNGEITSSMNSRKKCKL